MASTVLVVPAYNEATRFRSDGWAQFLEKCGAEILFVNDGSSDATKETLERFCDSHRGRAEVLSLPKNGGKGEAIRAGLLYALKKGTPVAGYADADLATPPEEIARVLNWIEGEPLSNQVFLGSRIKILGTEIRRKASRHYLGRVFATFASITLKLAVYDTQCGFKVFRCPRSLEAALQEPFLSRWVFDVELISRMREGIEKPLRIPDSAWIEVPLRKWEDVAGSKLKASGMAQAAFHLFRLYLRLRKTRRQTP